MKRFEQSLLVVSIVVIFAHAVALCWVIFHSDMPFFSEPKKRVVVNTVALRQTEYTKTPQQKKGQPPKVENKTTPIIKKVSEQKKVPPPKEKVVVKRTPAANKKQNPLEEKKLQLLAKAKDSMAKIREEHSNSKSGHTKASSELRDLGMIDSLRIDSSDMAAAEDMGYNGVLACRLREALRLPELGEVKMRLSLNRSGEVVKVEILSSESEYNRQHVEKILPSIKFPPFGKNFGNEKQHSFTLTLTNDV